MTKEPLSKEMHRLMALAWPVMLAHFQWLALNLIDTAMVGHYSTTELAYLGAARILNWSWFAISMGLISGVTVYVARADGAKTPLLCGAVLRQGMVYASLIALAGILFMLVLGEPLLRLADLPPDMAAGGGSFARIYALCYLPSLIATCGNYFLEGISRPRPVMIISLITLPINAAFNWLFIYGNAGLPPMGANGAAVGTVLAVLIGSVLTLAYLWGMADRARYGIGQSWQGAWRDGRELRAFGIVPGIASGMEMAGFAVLSALAATMGAVTAAAFQAIFSLHILSLTVTMGMTSATAVRVGNAVGAREPDEIARRGWLACAMAALSVGCIALIYLAVPGWSLHFFTSDQEMLDLAARMLVILAPFLIFDGAQFTLLFALRAAGDQVVAGWLQISGFCLTMSLVAWLLVHKFNAGPMALPIALAAGCVVAFILMALRWLSISRDPPALRAVPAEGPA
jgi:multidrug resistance protein, MATE family